MATTRGVIPIKAVKVEAATPVDDGWRRLSTLSEPRLTEMVENYKSLGYEVEVRDIQRSEGSCTTCFDTGEALGQVFGTVYVRRGGDAAAGDDLYD
jgi:hypothetical protein